MRPRLKELKRYAEEFMEPEYTDDHRSLEILYECLRHKVAHLAYPYAVIHDYGQIENICRPSETIGDLEYS